MDRFEELLDEAVAAFRRRLADVVVGMRNARDPEAFCAAERDLMGLAQEVAAEVTQRVVQEVSVDKERRREALELIRTRAAERGIEMRVERDRRTEFRTLGGKTVEVATPYATARPRAGAARETRGPQGTGVYPVLDQLGVVGRCTPALRLLVSRVVCEANSVNSARELLASSGVEIDHKAALRLTYVVCEDALRARKQGMETVRAADEGPFVGRRVVAAVDGGRLNTRRRVAGRPRKGGRKHFEIEWREPKVITLYVLGEDGRRDQSVPSVIDGTLGDANAVFDLLAYHLLRLGGAHATELILVGDGAPWIWNRAEALRRRVGVGADAFREVVDYFHVVERLGAISRAMSSWTEEMQQTWLKVQKDRLKAGDVEAIEDNLRWIAARLPKEMTADPDYWSRNRERMRYAALRAQGIPIGSGAVESSVRRVINMRMKGASIFWEETHAEGILHLRAHAKSGRWHELEHAALTHTRWRPTARAARRAA